MSRIPAEAVADIHEALVAAIAELERRHPKVMPDAEWTLKRKLLDAKSIVRIYLMRDAEVEVVHREAA